MLYTRPVQPLTVLKGQVNGNLSSDILVPVIFPMGRGGSVLGVIAPYVRKLMNDAMAAGIVLTPTSNGDIYRTYGMQANLFNSRYKPASPNVWAPGRKNWGGKWYSHMSGAEAAVPGESNHGWGVAIDWGQVVNKQVVSLTSGALSWLQGYIPTTGFSWELQSEPWHIRWVGGDPLPLVVTPDPPVIVEVIDDMPQPILNPLHSDADSRGRRQFFKLRLSEAGSVVEILAFNGARVAPMPGVVDQATNGDLQVTKLLPRLTSPANGWTLTGTTLVVVADDGGTFNFPIGA